MLFKKLSLTALIIVIGVVLRLILIPLTSHSDTRGHYLGAFLLTEKKAGLGLYDYISKLQRSDILVKNYGDDFLVYSPLTYWIHALILTVEKPLFPVSTFLTLVSDIGSAQTLPDYFWLQYLLKTPYLFVDLACLALLYKLTDNTRKNLVTWLWSLNIPLIYSAYMMGQFDIFMVLLFLVALYLIAGKKPAWAALALGLSAGFKPFGLFLLPLLPGNKIKNIIVGALTYLVIILPYLPSPAFRQYALFAQQSDKLLYAKIMVSGSQYLPVFFLGLFLIYLMNIYKPGNQVTNQLMALSYPLLLFYSVTHYHPQWFSWVTPFLILLWVKMPKYRLHVSVLTLAHILIILSFDWTLNFGLFGIKYELFTALGKYYSPDILISLVRTALAATAGHLVLSLYRTSK